MKTYIVILLSSLFLMASCVKIEEVHQKYIPDGERIYRGKRKSSIG